MFDYKNCTIESLWKHIASYLESKNYGVTLVGGGVATIYSKGKYASGDLDFVLDSLFTHKEFKKAMADLGFENKTRVYSRSDCPFTIDVSTPPIEIGEDGTPEIATQFFAGQTIKILSPTECIKDRLNKAFQWKDDQAYQAALAVAKECNFNISKLEKFCIENKMQEIFDEFIKDIKK